jgi:hypothetical protein
MQSIKEKTLKMATVQIKLEFKRLSGITPARYSNNETPWREATSLTLQLHGTDVTPGAMQTSRF